MKITEVLKKDTGKIVLTAYVKMDSNELGSIMDKAKREVDEDRLNELHDKQEPLTDAEHKEIERLKETIDNIVPFEFELSEPTFEVISLALQSVYTEGGKLDTMSAGKVIFDACYLQNQGTLEEIKVFNTLYTSLCSKCYHSVVEIADIEYKKK